MQDQITELTALLAATAARVRPDQLSSSTPCDKFAVSDLLDHLAGFLAATTSAARKQPPPPAGPSPADPAAVAHAARQAGAAWADPAAIDGSTVFAHGEMPATQAAALTCQELALHGWDLARGTGQDYPVSDATGQTVLDVVLMIGDQARSGGGYGAEIGPPADATAFERALAASGRDPAWGG